MALFTPCAVTQNTHTPSSTVLLGFRTCLKIKLTAMHILFQGDPMHLQALVHFMQGPPLLLFKVRFLRWKALFLVAVTSAFRASDCHAILTDASILLSCKGKGLPWVLLRFLSTVASEFNEPISLPKSFSISPTKYRLVNTERCLGSWLTALESPLSFMFHLTPTLRQCCQ